MGVSITKFQEMDRRITWISIARAIDANGGVTETETPFTIWAGRDFRGGDGGSEQEEKSGSITANSDVIWFMRKRAIKLQDKIQYDGITYDIEKVEEDGRNNFIRVYCNADTTV